MPSIGISPIKFPKAHTNVLSKKSIRATNIAFSFIRAALSVETRTQLLYIFETHPKGLYKGHMQPVQNSSDTPSIFPARLMSPDEVKAATSQQKEIPYAVKSGWSLCGDVSEEFWMMMERGIEQVVYRVSAFTTSTNCGYVIFTIQVRDYQTRFLLQMGGVRHTRFISNGGRDGIFISLGRNGGDRTMLQKFQIQQHELEPLSSLSKRCVPKDFLSGLSEWQSAIRSAVALETIPSATPGITVRKVTLNIVTPPFEESGIFIK